MTLVMRVEGARRYSFKDEKTGRTVEGVNVYYKEVNEQPDADVLGSIQKKVSLPYDSFSELQKLTFPSNCEPVITQQLTSKGIKSNVTGFKPINK